MDPPLQIIKARIPKSCCFYHIRIFFLVGFISIYIDVVCLFDKNRHNFYIDSNRLLSFNILRRGMGFVFVWEVVFICLLARYTDAQVRAEIAGRNVIYMMIRKTLNFYFRIWPMNLINICRNITKNKAINNLFYCGQ